MDTYAVTHRGNVRTENEDSLYISGDVLPFVAAVADGMGGHNAGKLASSTVVDSLREFLEEHDASLIDEYDLKDFSQDVSDKMYRFSKTDADYDNMGTTLSVIAIRDDELVCAHVGDSRVYTLCEGVFSMLTVDHSYVQMLIDMNVLTEDEAINHPYSNVITRAIGIKDVQADVYTKPFLPGDSVLLCSDGLTRHVCDDEIHLNMANKTATGACEWLLSTALERGGSDNITVIMAKLQDGDRV